MIEARNYRLLDDIDSFSGPYAFLSNFWTCPVKFEGELWLSVEHAYVAAKNPGASYRAAIKAEPKPGRVKALGRRADLIPGWDEKKVGIMRELVLDKFIRNLPLRKMLIETESLYLIEGNNWGDRFWGQVGEDGLNWLGVILMETRELVQQQEHLNETRLHGADPRCKHNVVLASGGGVKCTKCPGWFCY